VFDFYQKRKLRNIIHSPYTRGVLLLLAVWVGWSAYIRYDIAIEMKERRIAAEQEAAALEARKAALEETVEYLSNERGIEAEMRRQFDVSLPGEQVVVIVENEQDKIQVEPLSSSTQSTGEKRWYQFWR
tara:strand:- start:1668 stop:2054 length:387 start_codon:yes stop_codon:yes gene_type:complete